MKLQENTFETTKACQLPLKRSISVYLPKHDTELCNALSVLQDRMEKLPALSFVSWMKDTQMIDYYQRPQPDPADPENSVAKGYYENMNRLYRMYLMDVIASPFFSKKDFYDCVQEVWNDPELGMQEETLRA